MRDPNDQQAPAAFVSNALRRHLFLILVMVLVGAAVGVGVALRQGIQYTATATILVNPLDGNPFAPDGRGEQLVNLETEAQLVSTEGVAALVIKKLHSKLGADRLLELVEVENPTNTQVLRISFTAPSRSGALHGAQAFAESYLDYRESRAKSITDARLGRIRKQQSDTQAKLGDVTDELSKTSQGSARRAYLEERISALASQLASFETEVSTLTAADIAPGQVISPASLPIGVGGTNAILFGGAGAIGGFVLAALLALFRARSDDRLHDPYDIEDQGIRLLGTVPDNQRFGGRTNKSNPASRDLPEAYRQLRTAIVNSVDAPPVALGITSVSAGVTAAPEAAGLATGLARAGFSVALVDTGGEATTLFAGSRALPGLADVLAGTDDVRNVLVQPEDNLVLLPLGAPHRDTMDQLLSPRMRATIRRLREWYEYVLVTGQPTLGADGQALASLTDGVVLVAARKETTRGELDAAVAALSRVQAVPIGAVVLDGRSAQRSPGRRPTAAIGPTVPPGADPWQTRSEPPQRRSEPASQPDRSARSSNASTPDTYYVNGSSRRATKRQVAADGNGNGHHTGRRPARTEER
ncbi:MAG TPA: Wzz/FepE/Etk N-terminal domain-containing protein [Actinopolymorphaceae bacterium]|nr:Wzz/FepE/Etk N-terminal domain-containing protein [Actinopolymorphaceae bacterium]